MANGEAANKVDRRDAKSSATVTAQLAADHIDLVAVTSGQRACDVRGVGNYRQAAMVEQFAGDIAGNDTGMEHRSLAIVDASSYRLGNCALGLDVVAHAAFEGQLSDNQRQADGAMHIEDRTIFDELFDVATHGFQRHPACWKGQLW